MAPASFLFQREEVSGALFRRKSQLRPDSINMMAGFGSFTVMVDESRSNWDCPRGGSRQGRLPLDGATRCFWIQSLSLGASQMKVSRKLKEWSPPMDVRIVPPLDNLARVLGNALFSQAYKLPYAEPGVSARRSRYAEASTS